jgi:hypothetical protein
MANAATTNRPEPLDRYGELVDQLERTGEGDQATSDDRWQHVSTLEIRVEVAHDGRPDWLAEDMAILIERTLEERGFDAWGHSCRGVLTTHPGRTL